MPPTASPLPIGATTTPGGPPWRRSAGLAVLGPRVTADQPLLRDQPTWPGEPAVQRLARALRVRLLAGVWVDDEPLPSLRQLAAREGVSLATVQRAADLLVAEGLLRAQPRRAHRP
ncbi:MAG: winged helix-turn-helix domain-containing protein, partial [Candidatus Latescibacterota bacterium]